MAAAESRHVVAGDVGGTKTLVALYERDGEHLRLKHEQAFPSRTSRTFEDILTSFLEAHPQASVDVGCFAVAGPVLDGHVKTTNLPWEMDEKSLAGALGARRVKLLNDLEGTAYGMPYLPPAKLHVLNPGTRKPFAGNVAVIAAGTGLGEAYLWWDGERHHPIASEGGHADFAPHGERDIDLLRHLNPRFHGHVSYERVLSGPGLANVYEFLVSEHPERETSEAKARIAAAPDPSPVISALGLAGGDPLASEALDLFCRIYGAEAGNLALRWLAVGGVFLGGGIAPKILPALDRGGFLEAFTDKGRFADLMRSIPVRVSLEPKTALLGAAHYALRL